MLYIDLIVLRILLTGLTISLLLGLFLMLRRLLPRMFAPGFRRIIWLVLLFTSLLIIPFPSVLKLPADLPLGFFQHRLPDPENNRLSEQDIVDYFAKDSISLNSLVGEGDDTFADTIASAMRELNLLPEQKRQDKIIGLLPWLRVIYLSGFAFALLVHLIYYLIYVRNKMICRTISVEGREAWQTEIIALRDQSENYRQADVMMYDCDCDRPSRWLKNWRRHILAVPAGQPDEMSVSDRKDWLQAHLDTMAHPDYLTVILWLIVRSLFWFNPFWHSSWCCYSKDFIDFKINRIRHKQGLKSGLINNIIISFTGFVTCLALLLVIVFLAWQMPRHILPTVNSSQIAAQADVPVVTRSIPSDRYILTDYRVIYDDTSLISISDSSSRFDSLLRLDSNGDVIWLSSIYSLLDMPVYPSVEMLDTCQIAEDHWTIAVKIGRAQTQVPEIWYICVDGLGKPVSRQIITLPDEYGRLDIDYRVVITLAPDGGWIQSIYSIKNVKSSQTTLPAYTSQNLLNLSRYDAQGQALWSLDPATTDLQDINNSFIMNEKVVKFKRIQQIVPTADGGCAVLTLGQIRLTRFNRETSHEESAFYYDVGQLFIISAAGDITRTQDLIGKAGYFQVFQAFANDDGTLYLIGLDMQPDPGLSALEEISYPAIQAIAADGSIKFSIIAAESGQYNLRGAMMQDQQLTLLLHDVYKGSALYQIDLEGQNRWLDILDPDDGFIPMALVTDDQIVAFSNAISPDEKPGA